MRPTNANAVSTAVKIALLILVSCSRPDQVFSDNQPLLPTRAMRWVPPAFPKSRLHARIPYLKPSRAWERMDVWVPKTPASGKLPCVVVVYGGGYGDKSGGFIKDARPLLKRGFVIAAPDYALKTDAPVPLCSWDIANAIRYLRANAKKYRIDPERIGIWGWSAGGWIAQDLCYAGPRRIVHSPRKINRKKISRWFPMLQPRPQHPEQSVRVQAVVTDWGAGKLWDKRRKTPKPWLSPDDPPLFTCYNGAYSADVVNPVMLLRKRGVPSFAVYGIVGNTHVPKLKTAAVREDGRKTTWGEAIYEFFERRLKHIETATAPEMLPHGGAIDGPTKVRLLTVHPTGSIHYTLDGSEPSAESPSYSIPVVVKPGQTLRAICVRKGLKSSRITTGEYVKGPATPRITTTQQVFQAIVGKPFRMQPKAKNGIGASWYLGGKTGEQYREFNGKRSNPPHHIPWLKIDSRSGVLSGTPRIAGVYPVIVSCMTRPIGRPATPATGDAVLIVIRVQNRK